VGTADHSKGCWNPKPKLPGGWVTIDFSEIIELKLGKKISYIVL